MSTENEDIQLYQYLDMQLFTERSARGLKTSVLAHMIKHDIGLSAAAVQSKVSVGTLYYWVAHDEDFARCVDIVRQVQKDKILEKAVQNLHVQLDKGSWKATEYVLKSAGKSYGLSTIDTKSEKEQELVEYTQDTGKRLALAFIAECKESEKISDYKHV